MPYDVLLSNMNILLIVNKIKILYPYAKTAVLFRLKVAVSLRRKMIISSRPSEWLIQSDPNTTIVK